MTRARTVLTTLIFLGTCLAVPCIPGMAAGGQTADYFKTPVLMIHGYFVVGEAGIATWTTMKKNLIADGWPEEYIETPSFKNVRGCNADHVQEIEAWVQAMLAKHPRFPKIDIVCHSFGCLNTLTWLRDKCGVNRVRQFVGLAGAVHGTWVANADPFSCAAREMKIGIGDDAWKNNELLARVNACDETPGDVQYTTVWSEFDEIIRPPSGAEMAGARNIEVETRGVEHGLIFLCDECYDHVHRALKDGGLNEDGPGWHCIPECAPPVEPEPETGEPLPDEPVIVEQVEVVEQAEVVESPTDAGFKGEDLFLIPEEDPGRPTDDDTAVVQDPGGEPQTIPETVVEPAPRARSGGCSMGHTAPRAIGYPGVWLLLLTAGFAAQRLFRRRISRA